MLAYKNYYKIPVAEGCTGKIYYKNKLTNEEKEMISMEEFNSGEWELKDESYKPKYSVRGHFKLIRGNDKIVGFYVNTDEDLSQYSDVEIIAQEVFENA